jgi:nitrous-oxide reductase
MSEQDGKTGLNRRQLLGTSAAVVAGGAALGGITLSGGGTPAHAQQGGQSAEVAPGALDEYYVFTSGGHSGEIRITGLPSMRELMRIPVFNRESATGWDQTNESRRVLTEGLTPEAREFLSDKGGVYMNGDLHHPHVSFTDGTFDGRYLFCNDKANTRVARIRLDVMRVDKIIQLPNQHTVHGLRLPKFPRTGYVYANGEDGVPLPNDGKIHDNPTQYRSIFSAIDGDTMQVAWQIQVDGNFDNVDSRLPGQVLLLDLLQLRERRHPRRHDGQRRGLGRHLQPQAHRGGGRCRQGRDDQRRAGARRQPRLAL